MSGTPEARPLTERWGENEIKMARKGYTLLVTMIGPNSLIKDGVDFIYVKNGQDMMSWLQDYHPAVYHSPAAREAQGVCVSYTHLDSLSQEPRVVIDEAVMIWRLVDFNNPDAKGNPWVTMQNALRERFGWPNGHFTKIQSLTGIDYSAPEDAVYGVTFRKEHVKGAEAKNLLILC